MTDEYIRKQDAVDELQFEPIFSDAWNALGEARDRIKSIKPADVVPVVRCKDCKYNATTHKCLNPDSFFLIPKDDDFCSYGEKREE